MNRTTEPSILDYSIDRIERCFWEFHIANPLVYNELRDYALDLQHKGRKHYGVKALFEVVRFHRALLTDDQLCEWKLNNSYTALYARLLMSNEPELRGFFRTRTRPSSFKNTTPQAAA
jgi:hypothetical protein